MATTIPNRTALIVSPHLYLADVTGRPLDYGRVYFGQPNKDGEFYPINIFSDKELTEPLAQPVYTKGGFLNNNGDITEVFAYEGVYSVKVLDQYGRKIFFKGEVAKQTIEDATSDVVDAAQVEINRRMFLLDAAIAAAAAAGAGASGWTDLLVNNADDKPLRNVIVEQVESIADLSSIKKINKRTVFVKSYYTGKGKGGGTFVYDATKANTNDGALVFNGWVRQLDNDIFTPYMSGCKCDGVTDDAQNLDKLTLALFHNGLGGCIVFDKDIMINSELPRTSTLKYYQTELKVGVRLVSNIHLQIQGGASIKIGNYFNDSKTTVFCGYNYTNSDDWHDSEHHDNVKIFGGGKIDSTLAGKMASSYISERALIDIGGLTNFHLYDVTITGGDYANILFTRPKAVGGRVYNCKFYDIVDDTGKIRDHTTLMAKAPDWKIYNNRFVDNNKLAKSIACAYESHGDNSYFYNNYIEGYCNVVFNVGYKWDKPDAQLTKEGFYVYNNIAHTVVFMQYYSDRRRPYGHSEIYGNVHYALPDFEPLTGFQKFPHRTFCMINSEFEGAEFTDVLNPQIIRDNTFVGANAEGLRDVFFDTSKWLCNNFKITGNYIKAHTIAIIKNYFESSNHIDTNMKNVIIKDNYLDFSNVRHGTSYLDIEVFTMNNCDININFDKTYPRNIQQFVPTNINVFDKVNSLANKIRITHEGQSNIDISVSSLPVIITNYPDFAKNNSITYDGMADVVLRPFDNTPNFAIIFTDYFPIGFKNIDILSFDIEQAKGFVIPSRLLRNKGGTDAPKYVGTAIHSTMNNTLIEYIHLQPSHVRASS